MRDVFEILVPCMGVTTMLLLLFGFIALMRYISYRETLALAEKGLVKPEKRNGNGALIWGIIITSLGAALCLGLYPIGFLTESSRFPLALGPWLLPGILPIFFGLGLILIHVLTRPSEKSADKKTPTALSDLSAQPAAEPSPTKKADDSAY